MLGRIGMPELIFIFLVIFLLFGAKALPEIAKGLAKGIRIFKKEIRDIKDDSELDEVKKVSDASLHSTEVTKEKDTSNDFDPSKERRDWRPKADETKEVS